MQVMEEKDKFEKVQMPPRKKPGPKPILLNEDQLRMLGENQWSLEMIAAFYGISRDTVRDRYSTFIENARLSGKGKLLSKAFSRVNEKSDKVLIYLLERMIFNDKNGVLNLGDTLNIQMNQINIPAEKLTEKIDSLINNQKQITDGKDETT